MIVKIKNTLTANTLILLSLILTCASCTLSTEENALISSPMLLEPAKPISIKQNISGTLLKKMTANVINHKNYASLSIISNNKLLVDSINLPKKGEQTITALVKFEQQGDTLITLQGLDADITINSFTFEDVTDLYLPHYEDITVAAGMDKATSIKYGGPTVADIDNDGDYDFIVNNHNAETSKLYWNNGNGTVSKHDKNLARWFMHDLHGTAAGDFDNDGDLDIAVTQGGGNGKDPSKVNFFTNNDGKLILTTGDVNIDKGGRGRGAKWVDMDLDGDLDLILVNEASLTKEKPQHFFYKNLGNGTFEFTSVDGIQDIEPSRAIVTDLNNDHIDDLIFYSPLSIWQGNGDFTYTDITSQIPSDIAKLHSVMAITDIDIDNDGDLDLYLARGKAFEHGEGESPSFDHNPLTKELSIKPRGYKGVNKFEFTADSDLVLNNYNYLAQGSFRGKEYPIFLGRDKSATVILPGDKLDIAVKDAQGFPEDISANGVYFGHIGEGKWKAALVRNGNIFWTFRLSLQGVTDVKPDFVPENRNIADVLLRNDGGKFTDVSQEWDIPRGGNALGVTTGDFNNDSYQDLFVYRWGYIGARISDYMLLNTGEGKFETVTMHGANDVGGPGNGDMGQAFDFDLDGDVDLLNGSEDGEWYLYSNSLIGNKTKEKTNAKKGNYALVRVGYSPKSNIDAISAEVIVRTKKNEYRKRVGSAGSVFSSSLLNIIHFGLGEQDTIKSITIRWRNGETVVIHDKQANALFDTNKLDPTEVKLIPATMQVRKGSSIALAALVLPKNANKTLTWSSSDTSVLTVNNQGVVTAVGKVNAKATIKSTSPTNGMSSSSIVSIVEWFSLPVTSVEINHERSTFDVIEGQTLALNTTVLPQDADESSLTWVSSHSNIASVDNEGTVKANQAGKVTITVSAENKKTKDSINITVKPYVAPYINIVDAKELAKTNFVVGDEITLNANYHAGSGNRVISSDEGGIRFWLRLFKYQWIPANDTIIKDSSALKTESGSSTATFSLKGLTPSNELPEGYFYYLRASFTSSTGESYDDEIYPINIVNKLNY